MATPTRPEAGTAPPPAMVAGAVRWALLACAAGIAAGIGASLFLTGLDVVTGAVDGLRRGLPWWAVFAFPPVGGFAVGYLLWRTDRGALGSACGTDSFIDAVEDADGRIPPRVPALRILGAWLTIGFGGSSGRECPMIYTGAGLGSAVGAGAGRLGRRVRGRVGEILTLTPRDTRLLALCGAAGALGAVFSAPFGGAVFAVEVPYRRGADMGLFWPALVASWAGFGVGALVVGRQRLLMAPVVGRLTGAEWALVVAVAVAASLAGRLFAVMFDTLHRLARTAFPDDGGRLRPWWRTGAGGLCAGLVMVAFPQVYGLGFRTIRDTAAGRLFTGHTAVAAALLLAGMGVAKMLATSFTVGSGGVGGLLFPTMVAGAAVGGAAATVAEAAWPGQFPHHAGYVLVAMSATYAAAGKVPLASLLLVCEATGNFSLALPMAVANAIAYALSGRSTVYDVQRQGPAGRGYLVAVAATAAIVLAGQHIAAV